MEYVVYGYIKIHQKWLLIFLNILSSIKRSFLQMLRSVYIMSYISGEILDLYNYMLHYKQCKFTEKIPLDDFEKSAIGVYNLLNTFTTSSFDSV